MDLPDNKFIIPVMARDEPDGLKEACQYRRLYHASVERCNHLLKQEEKYSQLLQKHKKILELENIVMKEYKQESAELQKVCAGLIVRATIARAENKTKDDLIEDMKSRKIAETTKVKDRLTKYSHSLQCKYRELKDSLEFSEAERTTLMEANSELESERKFLKEANSQLELDIKTLHTQLEGLESTTPLTQPLAMPDNLADSSCLSCCEFRKYLSTAIEALNNRGCAKYGDLLHSNFILQQKLNSTESNYQRLTSYIQEYKTRSIEKVRILKENIDKADEEISELDKLVDRVREEMHSNMGIIRNSPHLLKLLAELDGTLKQIT